MVDMDVVLMEALVSPDARCVRLWPLGWARPVALGNCREDEDEDAWRSRIGSSKVMLGDSGGLGE